jgi:hypothetical protein
MKHGQGPMTWNSSDGPLKDVIHIHHENTSFDKIHYPWSWSLFWHMTSKVLVCVIPFHRVKLWVHSITSNFCSTTYAVQLGRSIQNCLKIPSSYITMLQSTQQTLLRIVSNIGDVKFYSTLPVLLTSVHVTMIWFPNWSNQCLGNDCREDTLAVVWHEVAQISVSSDAWDVHHLPHDWQLTIYNFVVGFEGC